ncbi:MmgE/PrpD family protein [Coniella lustricola]|uniref:MmgE/PrpD family protein n=1 Tax=Coniella lustricola TaxID=2025994 RepID=A0A2T2ZZF9_9PEZI|nr:MmgE/PrpD family protein [Coniella lustricola]
MATSPSTAALLQYIAEDLTTASIPGAVWLRIEELFLDWLASALAASHTHPIPTFVQTARQMGGTGGGSAVVISTGEMSSPYWAAWVNAAASHTLEQDDLHNSSVMHPATVVFPAVFAAAHDNHKSGREMLLASIAGYEAGIRIAESLGRSHYRIFHTTATVGTLAAAVAVAKLLGFSFDQLVSAVGTAGTQTSGLWEFMRSGAGDSKQLHCAHAAANGLLSAYMTRDGLLGALDVVEGEAGLLRGLSKEDADAQRLVDGLGSRWAVLETSFKFHACCRHTHPAADALLDALDKHSITDPLQEIQEVVARVHQGAIDVLGPVDAGSPPQTVHAAKFSMKTTLALIALQKSASLWDFEQAALTDPAVLQFRERVSMELDGHVDGAYPKQWLGRVELRLTDGRVVQGGCDEPKGDPGNTLSRDELEDKFRRLHAYGGWSGERGELLMEWCWSLRTEENCTRPWLG